MKKRLCLLMIIFTIMILSSTSFATTKFSDVHTGEWFAYNAVTLADKGFIKGYPDGSFGPNKNITVSEFITVTVRALDPTVKNATTGNWYQPYVDKALQLGLTEANEFSSHDYKRSITRGEMARLLVRSLETTGTQIIEDSKYISSIKDYDTISNSFKTYILKAYVSGIMGGYPDGNFRPSQLATRADSSVMLHRMIEPSIRLKITLENSKYVSPDNVPLTSGVKIDPKPFMHYGVNPYTSEQVKAFKDVMEMLDSKYPMIPRTFEYSDITSTFSVGLMPTDSISKEVGLLFSFNNFQPELKGFIALINNNKTDSNNEICKSVLDILTNGYGENIWKQVEIDYETFLLANDKYESYDHIFNGTKISISFKQFAPREIRFDIYK